ncbi:MAG: cell division protein FtsL [Methylococcales bacterium]|nr:cell division protein FtsL [Methylococcales bacterium]
MFYSKPLLVTGLVTLLLITALSVILSKYNSRLLYIEIQKKEKKLDGYEVEWGRLQLELTTLTEENRVESVAKKKLQLIMPQRDKIIYLKQSL